jgi:hypothetical protein
MGVHKIPDDRHIITKARLISVPAQTRARKTNSPQDICSGPSAGADKAHRNRGTIRTGPPTLHSSLDQNLEAAEDQPLAVEGHWVDVGLNTRVDHHFFHALVAALL